MSGQAEANTGNGFVFFGQLVPCAVCAPAPVNLGDKARLSIGQRLKGVSSLTSFMSSPTRGAFAWGASSA